MEDSVRNSEKPWWDRTSNPYPVVKQPAKRTALETKAEVRFVKEAKKLGYLVRKLNGAGNRSWPDRLVIAPNGVVVLIEFKREKSGKLDDLQEIWHGDAEALGHSHRILVTSSWTEALEFVKSLIGKSHAEKRR